MDKAKNDFKGKKVTILGLGLLGKGLGDALFLAKAGAQVTVTDLKTAKELATSVAQLKKYKNVRFVLGKHEFSDFENCDFVLKAQGVKLDSLYVAHARARKIPIRMDDELFCSYLSKGVKVVGVTGTRGKTTTTSLIYHILKKSGKTVHLGGNIRGVATLSLLPKVKEGDIVVLELSSWQLQGFGERKISPDIAVFTNFMPDHMNYYNDDMKLYFKDKAYIFKYQKPGDTLVVNEKIARMIPKSYKGKLLKTGKDDIKKDWKLPILGEHNKENIALAISACKVLGLKDEEIKKGVESFKAVEGRLQYMKTVRGVAIYNDNNSTTPHAGAVALESFAGKNVVLIAGGADKGIDMSDFTNAIKKNAKALILLPGNATHKLKLKNFESKTFEVRTLAKGVEKAMKIAQPGDIILFSPGLASFGLFKNEYDRNDQFVEIIKNLK